jgi:hypothetical protein
MRKLRPKKGYIPEVSQVMKGEAESKPQGRNLLAMNLKLIFSNIKKLRFWLADVCLCSFS